MEVGLMKDLIG